MVFDFYKDHALTVTGQGLGFEAVTPADADLDEVPRALYVGGAGDLVVIGQVDDHETTFKNVGGGQILPIRVKRVCAATTATHIVAFY